MTLPMRLMPPRMATPARVARITPVIQVGTPKYSRVVSAALQVWNMLPPVTANSSRDRQKKPPTNLPKPSMPGSLPRALRATYMAPPCGFPASEVSR